MMIELFYIGMPVVRRTVGRAYGHVTTKIFRMHRSPNFLAHGAPLLTLRARENSAITTATIISSFQFVFIPQFTSLSSFFKKDTCATISLRTTPRILESSAQSVGTEELTQR